MAARKLQTEIDRTLKKVAEGVELFESIYEKMQASTNQTQKEKQEMDLKTQIKKLQRLRDQIKAWVASNDIKDKTILLENRRLIETQMEKFKACEKEMKTKAFSKEGLIQAAKLDPKEQEKEDAMQWLQQQVEELQMQIETTEAEIEGLQGTGKKKSKAANAGRLEELDHLNDRRKWHISRLELVLRLLNNGSLSADNVNSLREDVQYFVSNNTDDDFDEDDGIYDDLNLDEAEGEFGLVADEAETSESEDASEPDIPQPPKSKKKEKEHHEEEASSPHKQHDSPILKKAGISLVARKQSVDSKPPPNINFSQQPMASVLKSGLPQPTSRPAAPTLPPIRYAAAAAAAVTSHPPTSASAHPPSVAPATPALTAAQASTAASTPSLSHSTAATSQEQPSPSLTQQSVTSPTTSTAASVAPSEAKAAPFSPTQPIAARKDSLVATPSPPVVHQATAPAPEPTPSKSSAQQQPTQGPSPLPQQLSTPSLSPGIPVAEQQPQAQPVAPPAISQPIGGQRPSSAVQAAQTPAQRGAAFPGSLSDLVVSFENVKQKAMRQGNLDQVHKMLEGGLINVPQPQDTDKPKYYVPRNPFPTVNYYPQQPLATLGAPTIFSQLDVETLFYVFYYLPGTYQQYLAAKELKRQSWRFHVKYLTWFQRHSEPQAITEEYEQGVYVYFDWEGSWCQRKKSDFRFEYRYLSED